MSEDTHHIDVGECRRRRIEVVTLPKISKDTVANLTMALLIQTMGGMIQTPSSALALGKIQTSYIHACI